MAVDTLLEPGEDDIILMEEIEEMDAREAHQRVNLSMEVTDRCDECGDETYHNVGIALVTEGYDSDNSDFSKEPYRVAECQDCHNTYALRMNSL